MKIYHKNNVTNRTYQVSLIAIIVVCTIFSFQYMGWSGLFGIAFTYVFFGYVVRPRSYIFLLNGELGLKQDRATLFSVRLDDIVCVQVEVNANGAATTLLIETASDSYSIRSIKNYEQNGISSFLDELRAHDIKILPKQ